MWSSRPHLVGERPIATAMSIPDASEPYAAQVAPLAAVYAGDDSPAILAAEQRRLTELTDWEPVSRSAG